MLLLLKLEVMKQIICDECDNPARFRYNVTMTVTDLAKPAPPYQPVRKINYVWCVECNDKMKSLV